MTVETRFSADETAPLLSPTPKSDIENEQHDNKRKKFLILAACGVFILAADFGFYMSTAPQTSIFEQIICRNYLANLQNTPETSRLDLLAEDPCKSEFVQGELAVVNGYKETFNILPSILLSLPYGVLADHWGRKPVLYLGIMGILMSELWVRFVAAWSEMLPLRLVWLSGLFRVIGGGDQVVTSMAIAMVADVFSEEER